MCLFLCHLIVLNNYLYWWVLRMMKVGKSQKMFFLLFRISKTCHLADFFSGSNLETRWPNNCQKLKLFNFLHNFAFPFVIFFERYTRWHLFTFKAVRKIHIRYKYKSVYRSSSASCTLKLNRPSKPVYFSFGQLITQTPLPRCIAINILWNRKKVDNFSPVASWIIFADLLWYYDNKENIFHSSY